MIPIDTPNPYFRIPSTAHSIKLSEISSCELLSGQCTLRHPQTVKAFPNQCSPGKTLLTFLDLQILFHLLNKVLVLLGVTTFISLFLLHLFHAITRHLNCYISLYSKIIYKAIFSQKLKRRKEEVREEERDTLNFVSGTVWKRLS